MDLQEQVLKARRETMRWQILVVLEISAPAGSNVRAIKPVIAATYDDVTDAELAKNLDYLHERELIHLSTDPMGNQVAKLARYGFDIVQRTVDCDPGIARPSKS